MDIILKVNEKNYCAFGGHEITPSPEGQLLCQCENAKQYRKALHLKLQLELEASKIMQQAPKPKYGLHTIVAPINEEHEEKPLLHTGYGLNTVSEETNEKYPEE